MRNDFESNYLMHHGILGQRWGHKNGPPYPLDANDHSSSEKKAGWMKSLSDKHKANVKKRKQKKALEKARKTKIENAKKAAEKQAYEDEKQKALKSGKASDILKYKGDLTNKELQDAVQRLNWEKQLKDISDKEIQTGWDKMDNIMDKAKKVTNYAETGLKAYETIEKVVKKFSNEPSKEDEDKAKKEAIEKVINSRNAKLVNRYASVMDNAQLSRALSGLSTQENLENRQKAEKEAKAQAKLEKQARKAAQDHPIRDVLEEMTFGSTLKDQEAKRQKEIDDFYDGPQFIDDDEKKKKKR